MLTMLIMKKYKYYYKAQKLSRVSKEAATEMTAEKIHNCSQLITRI
jgi:hypothetical protein